MTFSTTSSGQSARRVARRGLKRGLSRAGWGDPPATPTDDYPIVARVDDWPMTGRWRADDGQVKSGSLPSSPRADPLATPPGSCASGRAPWSGTSPTNGRSRVSQPSSWSTADGLAAGSSSPISRGSAVEGRLGSCASAASTARIADGELTS